MVKRGKQFEPGNKFGRGRPPGSRNKRSLSVQQLLDNQGDAVISKSLELALAGDSAMLRALLGHLLPRRNDPPVEIGPLPMATAEELGQSAATVLEKVAAGQITPSQARQVFAMLDTHRKILETEGFDARLRAIEGRLPGASE